MRLDVLVLRLSMRDTGPAGVGLLLEPCDDVTDTTSLAISRPSFATSSSLVKTSSEPSLLAAEAGRKRGLVSLLTWHGDVIPPPHVPDTPLGGKGGGSGGNAAAARASVSSA
jgi:hypothetical protein